MLPVLFAGTVVGCAGDSEGQVRFVRPGDDVQSVVDDARPGDLLVFEPGVYTEPVVVSTEGVTLRGRDRNAVIFDGQHARPNGITVLADDVAVENLTARNWQVNGVFFTGASSPSDTSQLSGVRVSHVTAYNNGLYGIYLFQSGGGVVSDSYASGHPDSGFYVGQCQPCNVTLDRVVAENNAVGYEGTNASDVYVVNSVFRANRVGITPNSQNLEKLAPQGMSVFAGNLVVDNGNIDAPEQASGAFGLGIAIGGGVSNRVVRNRVVDNAGPGILVTTLDGFEPSGNVIEGNVLSGNMIDLGFWLYGGVTDVAGNRFVANRFETSTPGGIESMGASVDVDVPTLPVSKAGPFYRDVPAPGPQKQMDAETVETQVQVPAWVAPEIDNIDVPEWIPEGGA